MLNGVPGRWINCKNGLRQGDPLSPYLFLSVAELLRCLIVDDSGEGRLRHPLADYLPCRIIQYADDTLIILPADPLQVARLRSVLDTFSRATGLEINFHKSTFVPIHVPPSRATHLASILECSISAFPQNYLGLPLSDHKLPASALEFLATKITKQIPGWRTSLIPIGGRLTLSTAVLSALPLHAMSVLPLQKGVVAKMDRPRRAMLWKAAAVCSGGDCQVAWDFVCRLRSEGGLGVVDFGLQNTCLLLKTLHSLFSGRDTPWTRWVRRSYMCSCPQPSTPSWRHFESLVPLYRSITRVAPVDGATTSLWHDSWTPLGPLVAALPSAFSHCLEPDMMLAAAVSGGSIPTQRQLSVQAVAELTYLHSRVREAQLAAGPDRHLVALGCSTEFRSGDVYRALHASGCVVPHNDLNWVNFAPPKVRVFFWILRLERTRTRAHLHRVGCVPVSDCPFCNSVVEDIPHVFVRCPRLSAVWATKPEPLTPCGPRRAVAGSPCPLPRATPSSSPSCGPFGNHTTAWCSTVSCSLALGSSPWSWST